MTPTEFQRFYGILPEPMLLVSLEGHVLAANGSAATLLGRRANDLTGTPLAALTADSPEKISRLLALFGRSAQFLPGSLTFTSSGIPDLKCRVEGARIPEPEGGVLLLRLQRPDAATNRFRELNERVDSLRHEVMERKLAENALRHQWRTFDTALSNTPDFTYIFDLAGRFTYVNRALLSLWQKPLEDAIGKNFFELGYPTELAARLQRQIQEVIQSKTAVRDRTPFTGPTGETRHYDYIFVPVMTPGGMIEAVAGSTRDVTEDEKLQKTLEESKQKLQQVFAQAPVAIVVFRGRDFVVEMANPSYRALVQGRELVGRRFADVMPELGQDVWQGFNYVMDTGEPFIRNDFHVPYDPNGTGDIEDHWFNLVYHPLREPDGSVSGFIAVLTRVTPQVLARKELERVNRQLEEFAYVASHDLQEPLRTVNIYSQLLLRRVLSQDADALQYGTMISQGVARMEALINDVLAYSRTAQKEEGSFGYADLSVSLREALTVLKTRIEECGARVSSAPLPTVRGDAAQLSHVFQNLLSNALKYARNDVAPEVRISARQTGDEWIVAVEDNGIGFDTRYAVQIFGLFKRLHKDEYPGTGLGLAICKRIVERYGGRIWAESEPGKGSTFFFGLPSAEGNARRDSSFQSATISEI